MVNTSYPPPQKAGVGGYGADEAYLVAVQDEVKAAGLPALRHTQRIHGSTSLGGEERGSGRGGEAWYRVQGVRTTGGPGGEGGGGKRARGAGHGV